MPNGTWNLEGRPRVTSDTSFIPLSKSPNPKTPVLRSSEISPRSRRRVGSQGPGWLYSLSVDVSFLESASSTIHAAFFSGNQKFLVFQETESSPSLFCDFGCKKCFSFEQWYQTTRNQALSSWDLAWDFAVVFSDCTQLTAGPSGCPLSIKKWEKRCPNIDDDPFRTLWQFDKFSILNCNRYILMKGKWSWGKKTGSLAQMHSTSLQEYASASLQGCVL